MRKLTLLLLALALALYAAAVVAGVERMAGYVLRDGLILFALAAALFGLAGDALPRLSEAALTGSLRRWSLTGRILAGLALGGALIAALLGLGSAWGLAAWQAALLALAIGVWLPGEPLHEGLPAYRWTTDAAGKWVRRTLRGDHAPLGRAEAAYALGLPARGLLAVALLIVGGAGVFLRLWRLGELPAGCMGLECTQALALVDGAAPGLSLFDLTAHLFFRITQDGLLSLRLAGAALGILTLPAFYWATRPLDRFGGGALAAMLLALSPWHVWAGRTSDPWMAAPLLIALALGAGLRATGSLDRRWWWGAGLAFGLPILLGGPFSTAALAWMLLAAGVGAWSLAAMPPGERAPLPARLLNVAAFLAAATVAGLPGLTAAGAGASAPNTSADPAAASSLSTLLTGLLYGGGAAFDYFLSNPLLAALPAALAALGLGRLARSLIQPRAVLIVAGLAASVVALARVDAAGIPAASLGLVWMPFLYLAAALALDGLLQAFITAWHALIPARTAAIAALALILLVSADPALGMARGLQGANSAALTSADAAMGRWIARCLAAPSLAACVYGEEGVPADPSFQPTFYAPASALEHPSTRLLLGAAAGTDAARSDQVRVLDVARDIPPSRMPPGALLYLAPIDNQPLISLLQQIYPHAETQAQPRSDGPTQFVVVAVPPQDLAERQGLEGQVFAGVNFGANLGDSVGDNTGEVEAATVRRDGPLQFDWDAQPPLDGPLSVVWQGSLRVPAAGLYAFAVDLPPAADGTPPSFTLQLDDRLVLDADLGLLENEYTLAQGFYRLAMRYRAEQPGGDWQVRWRLPGGEWQVIPRAALYSPALPDVGLLGSYSAGDNFQGPTLAVRKDFILGAQADLPRPYSVRWEGKLAAPRGGEYLFAVTSNGYVRMTVDGRELLAYTPDALDPAAAVFSQAAIYLPRGWHDVEIHYVPAEQQPHLRLLWQPPGSSPTLLFSRYLRPFLGELYAGDAQLPPAPDLLDARLGDDTFALSYVSDLARPQTVFPPMNLPPLLLEEVWRVDNGCGDGPAQLNAPHGVALDARGDAVEGAAGGAPARRVYVADSGNRRVLAFGLDDGAPAGVYGAGRSRNWRMWRWVPPASCSPWMPSPSRWCASTLPRASWPR